MDMPPPVSRYGGGILVASAGKANDDALILAKTGSKQAGVRDSVGALQSRNYALRTRKIFKRVDRLLVRYAHILRAS
jgi:hypothetical protein